LTLWTFGILASMTPLGFVLIVYTKVGGGYLEPIDLTYPSQRTLEATNVLLSLVSTILGAVIAFGVGDVARWLIMCDLRANTGLRDAFYPGAGSSGGGGTIFTYCLATSIKSIILGLVSFLNGALFLSNGSPLALVATVSLVGIIIHGIPSRRRIKALVDTAGNPGGLEVWARSLPKSRTGAVLAAIAMIAVALATQRAHSRAKFFHNRADRENIRMESARQYVALWENIVLFSVTDKLEVKEHQYRSLASARARVLYHARLREKYNSAAESPWRLVGSDPVPPDAP
jgi:hypothetical protein